MRSEQDQLSTVLKKAKRIAVVGLTDQPSRTSYQIARYLLDHHFEIIPVNPSIDHFLGIKAVSRLTEINKPVDIVNVFRRSEFLVEVAHDTIEIGAPVFWAQLGLYNEEALTLLEKKGILPIMNKCIMVEHRQLNGG